MAVKTYYASTAADGNFAALVDGVAQTAASRADGWTVGKIAATNQSDFDVGTKQATGTFAVSAKPASFLTGTTANAFKTPTPLTGTFAATFWSFYFAVRATVVSAQVGRMRLRVFKATNAAGTTGVVELTSGTQVGSSSGVLSTTVDGISLVSSWNPGAITLNNEYLFFVIAWEITTASGSNSGDVVLRTGSSGPAGTYILTPNFVVPVNTPITLAATMTMTPALTEVETYQKPVVGAITLVPAMTAAQVPKFPVIATVVDDFNRADQVPPGSAWQTYRYFDTMMFDSPRAYFHGDDPPVIPGIGTGLMYDWSGNGNHLTATGPNNGYQLPGINPNRPGYSMSGSPEGYGWYVGTPAWVQTLGDVFTIELWMQRNSTTDTSIQIIVDKYNGGFCLRLYPDGSIKAGVPSGYGMYTICSSTVNITDLLPHHVVYTKNGATNKIYIDGVDVTGTVSNTTVDWNTGYWMYFFTAAYGPGSNFRFSDFAIYTKALNLNQVRSHFRGSMYENWMFYLSPPNGYWTLGDKSGTVAKHATQQGQVAINGTYNGTYKLNQPGAITDDRDGSVELGSGGYISIPGDVHLTGTNHWHISAWIYPTASVAGDVMIFGHSNASGSGAQPMVLGYGPMSGSGQRTWAGFFTGSTWQYISDQSDVPLNQWTYVSATWDNTAGTLTLFRNGVQVATGAKTGKVAALDTTAMYIGRHWSGAGTFPGATDEVAVYPLAFGSGNSFMPTVFGYGKSGLQVFNNKMSTQVKPNYNNANYGDVAYWMPSGPPFFTHDGGVGFDQNAIGFNSTYWRIAQSFVAKGPVLQSVYLTWNKQGTPTDNLVIELCVDEGGQAGRIIGTIATAPASGALGGWYTFNCNFPLIPGVTYWITFRRTGPADTVNYVNIGQGTANADLPNHYYVTDTGTYNVWYRNVCMVLTSGSYVPGLDQEAYFYISTDAFANGSMQVRLRATPWADTYYYVMVQWASGNDYIYIYKRVNGAVTGLGTYDNTRGISPGDLLGVSIKGNKITVFHKPGAGPWVEVFNRTDSAITTPGFVALQTYDGKWEIDDFAFGSTKTFSLSFAALLNLIPGLTSQRPPTSRTFDVSLVFIPGMGFLSARSRAMNATMPVVATMARLAQLFKVASITATLTPVLVKKLSALRSISAATTISPTMAANRSASRAISAATTLIPGLSRIANFFRAPAATTTITPTMNRQVFGARTFAVVATFIPTLAKKLFANRTVAATTTVTPGMGRSVLYQKALAATTSIIPGLVKNFRIARAFVGNITFTPGLSWQKTDAPPGNNTPVQISVTTILIPAMVKGQKLSKAVAANVVLIPGMSKLLKLSQSLPVTVTLIPVLARKLSSLRAIAVTTVISPIMSKFVQGGRTFAVTANMASVLSRRLSAYRAFVASGVLAPTLSPRMAAGRLLSASTAILAAMTKGVPRYKSQDATVTLVPGISFLSGKGKVLSASVVLTPTMKRVVGKMLTVVATLVPGMRRNSTNKMALVVTLIPTQQAQSHQWKIFASVATLQVGMESNQKRRISLAVPVPLIAAMSIHKVTRVALAASVIFSAAFDYLYRRFERLAKPVASLFSTAVEEAQLLGAAEEIPVLVSATKAGDGEVDLFMADSGEKSELLGASVETPSLRSVS